MASGPITSWQIMGKEWQTLFSWAPKSLQMGISAMKLKETCSLEKSIKNKCGDERESINRINLMISLSFIIGRKKLFYSEIDELRNID